MGGLSHDRIPRYTQAVGRESHQAKLKSYQGGHSVSMKNGVDEDLESRRTALRRVRRNECRVEVLESRCERTSTMVVSRLFENMKD